MPEASLYRCADCRNGKDLMAWAPACAYGPVGADGDLAQHDDVWDDGIHEDSIQCTKHPSGVIEKCVDGVWCRWWNCSTCGGPGRTHLGQIGLANGYECHEGLEVLGKYGRYKIHRGWRPVSELRQMSDA